MSSVIAVNTAVHSENRMHDDEVARTYGFAGGLVPGVTVFAYAASRLAAEDGEAWLDGGAAHIRLLAPAYDGDHLDIDRDGEIVEVRRGEEVLARLTTALADEPPADAGPADRDGPRYDPTVDALGDAPPFSPIATTVDRADAADYAAQVAATGAPFADGSRVHPGWILGEANRVLAANVRLGPWIHVESAIRFLGPAPSGVEWATMARVRSAFERKGHVFCDVDCLVRADGRPAAAVFHRAIVQPAPKG